MPTISFRAALPRHLNVSTVVAATAALLSTLSAPTQAATPVTPAKEAAPSAQATVQVTATRFGDAVRELPMPAAVVTGQELRALGASDLRTALALLGGISVAPGGDAGPAGSTPALLGVREIDDLLLLVDGVPAGGAFRAQTEAISLVNIERIEVLRGSAPVYYGTAAFAGTIHIIHHAAGQADERVTLRYGSHGSVGASAAMVLSTGTLRQSASVELGDDHYNGNLVRSRRAQGQWRAAIDLGGGQLQADLTLMALRQHPGSPRPLDEAGGPPYASLLSVDSPTGPANARIDTDRQQLVLRHEMPLGGLRWGSTLSYTATQTDQVRGFIDIADTLANWQSGARVNGWPKADVESFSQRLHLKDLFIDSHLTLHPAEGVDLTTGLNLLYGQAEASSLRYAQTLGLGSGVDLPDVESVAPKTDVQLHDHRRLFGLYAQSRWTLTPQLSVLAGLRWNATHETREEWRRTLSTGRQTNYLYPAQDHEQPSGSLGLQWKAWQAPAGSGGALDALTLHASLGDSFQLGQVDFGPSPEARPAGNQLLSPERQRSLIVGLRADAWGGLAEFDIEGLFIDFSRQPTISGTSMLANGQQRFRGLDLESRWHPSRTLTLVANLGLSDARYRDYTTDVDGTPTQLSGRRLPLTPTLRATAGLVWAPAQGLRGSVVASHSGRRWLDQANTQQTPAYTVVDASIGYTLGRYTLQLAAQNLGNRRDPVSISELGEGQFDHLGGRRLMLSLSASL